MSIILVYAYQSVRQTDGVTDVFIGKLEILRQNTLTLSIKYDFPMGFLINSFIPSRKTSLYALTKNIICHIYYYLLERQGK